MGDVQVWREGSSGEPKFSADFYVVRKAILQVTEYDTAQYRLEYLLELPIL